MTSHTVAIVIHDGVQALDVAGPLDVFCEANGFLQASHRYEIVVVGQAVGPMRASSGLRLTPDLNFQDAAVVFSTVLVAGGPTLPDAPSDRALNRWLCDWGIKADRYGSICTGAFVFGHAGLLDGRTATTHWQNASRLAALFPAARIEPDRIFTRDGALVTSAGVTAGIDLALALVTEDHGSTVALACAKRLVVAAQRQGGQSQFSPFLLPLTGSRSPLATVQAYVMEHLSEAFPVERLAQIAGVSTRSVARMFAADLGLTPHEFIESARLDKARNLLEATSQALKTVAYECGFASVDQMRLVFQRRLRTSPARYREAFRISGELG